MNRAKRDRAGDSGFTMLEMLVTLAVLSCISTALLGGIVSVRHVTRQYVLQAVDDAQISAAQAIIRSRVEGLRALPRPGRTTPIVDIQGDGQRFSFYAAPLHRDMPSSIQAFRLLRMATGDLVLFSAPSLTEDIDVHSPSLVGWNATKLLSGVDDVSISYFGPAPGEPGGRWQQFWHERTQPPQLVRIGIKFAEGDPRFWPELVIRPGVTMNMACKFDTVSSRCSDTVIQ